MVETDSFSALGKEVPVYAIDAALKRLWAADEARTHAASMNVAIYGQGRASLLENSKKIERITRDHACRSILMATEQSDQSTEIRAWITAHCHMAYGRKSVCCEQISFLLTGKMTGRFRNTLFSHLSSDLPLVLWWQGELTNRCNEALCRQVDRLIIDSSQWSNAAEGMRHLREIASMEHCVPVDLEWLRSDIVRHATSELFEHPLAQAALSTLRKIELRVPAGHFMAGLGLLSWIASCQEWRVDKRQGRNFLFVAQDSDEPIIVTLEESDQAGICVEWQTGVGKLSLCHKVNESRITQCIALDNKQSLRSFPCGKNEDEVLLLKPLASAGESRLYTSLLGRIEELMHL